MTIYRLGFKFQQLSWPSRFIFACLITFVLISNFYFLITNLGYIYLKEITLEKENQIWHRVKHNFGFGENYRIDKIYIDLAKFYEKKINSLPKKLLPNKYPQIKVLVVEDLDINAFAAPGGRVILTTGLLDNLETQEGIMFVIGHEIGHLIYEDHLNEFARVIAANSLSVLTTNGNSLMVDFILALDSKNARQREYIADIHGIKVIQTIYGNAEGFREFFEKIANEKDNTAEIFSSHPSVDNRVKMIEKLLN